MDLCPLCARSGILCKECEKSLLSGRISLLDISLAKELYDMGLGDIGFEKSISSGDGMIILARKEDIGRLIGRGGENIKKLSSRFGQRVKFIGSEDLEDAIHDFIAPAKVSAINKVFLPDGSLMRKIKIDKAEAKKLRMGVKEIESLISSLTPDRIEISLSD